MSSNINPNNIDGTFPIAGQDNSSQGFRDNFTNIRNNFSYAQSEISDLQAKAITVSALSGGTLNNDMGYNAIKYAQLTSPSNTFLNLGTPTASSTVTLDYSIANYQKFTTNGNYTLAFANWPTSGQFGTMTLWINVTSTNHVITLPITNPGVTQGLNDIAGANIVAGTITFDQAGNYFLQFSTVDAGVNITITELNRNASTLRDFNFYWNDSISPTFLINYGFNNTMFNTVLGLEQGQDVVSARGSYNSVTVGNLLMANISNPMVDTGGLSGYSVSATRGNLATGTITPVRSGDLLGYVNAITYTGNVTANTFQQVSTIGFYASGSNVVAGLGGNVAIFTHAGGTTTNSMQQAVGVEADKSTKLFGNLIVSNVFVPSSSTTVGGVAGQVTFDSGFVYICLGSGNWKRAALTTF
jgi:hypothetical protein